MVKRQENNKEILKVLSIVVDRFPDWRFHQILQNINVTDREGTDKFYEESRETLDELMNNSIVRSILNE